MRVLNITNGDATTPRLRQAGVSGDILPWRDVLHEGPVPAGDDLRSVSRVRAEHIASLGWAEPAQVQRDFAERDAQLARAAEYERIVLWFEHDLYDQLQILQLLNWFALQPATHDRLFLICHLDYLGVVPIEELAALRGSEQPVTAQQLQLARELWQAFTARTPQALAQWHDSDTFALPCMRPALGRLLEFLPAPVTGLNRSERQALHAVARGITAPDVLFEACQQRETARFMGDASFWLLLEELCSGEQPLLTVVNDESFFRPHGHPYGRDFLALRLRLTETGRAVLAGEQDAMTLRSIDRWIGGTHLRPDALWRWDAIEGRLLCATDNAGRTLH